MKKINCGQCFLGHNHQQRAIKTDKHTSSSITSPHLARIGVGV